MGQYKYHVFVCTSGSTCPTQGSDAVHATLKRGAAAAGLRGTVRVNHAGQLLMESDRPVSSICYEVGFNNISNFNRRFLEVKGVTPSEYRRQAGQRFGGAAA